MLLYADSFDAYATADFGRRWTSGAGTISTAAKRNGTQGGSISNVEGFRKAVTPATAASGVLGMAWQVTSGACESYIAVGNGDGQQFYVQRNSADGSLILNNGGGTDLDVSDPGVIAADVWYYIELKWTIANSGGTVEVRVNGVPVITYTGDTQYRAAATWTYVSLAGTSATAAATYVDDFYICDTSGGVNDNFLGDVTVEALLPQTDAVAPGSNNSWTCGTGTDHGALVDESPPYTADDTNDYVYTSTLNAYDTWEYPSLSVGTATIYAVQVATCAKKSDTGAATYVNVARPASTNRDGGVTHSPSETSYTYGIQVWDVNPEDSLAWEVADINGCEFGVKRTG